MSRPNNTTERLLTGLAPDEDTGWQWIRKLHELGYTLNLVEPCVFYRGSEYIAYEVRKGVIVWRASYQSAVKADVVFPDPIAAAVWWETERENLAPVLTQAQPQAPAWQSLPPFSSCLTETGVQQLPPQIGIPRLSEETRQAILDGLLPPVVHTNGYGKP